MLPPNPKWMVKNIRWSLFFHWLINKALKPWQPAPWFLARSQNALPDGCSAHQAGRIRACPLSLYCHLGIKQSEWSAGGLLGYKTSPISLHCCLSFSLPLHNTKIKNHKKNSTNNKKSKKKTPSVPPSTGSREHNSTWRKPKPERVRIFQAGIPHHADPILDPPPQVSSPGPDSSWAPGTKTLFQRMMVSLLRFCVWFCSLLYIELWLTVWRGGCCWIGIQHIHDQEIPQAVSNIRDARGAGLDQILGYVPLPATCCWMPSTDLFCFLQLAPLDNYKFIQLTPLLGE